MLNIIATAMKSTTNVLMLCIPGLYLRRRGILDKHTTKAISKAFLEVLLPALLFFNMASHISWEVLRNSPILILASFVYVFCGLGMGFALLKCFEVADLRLQDHIKRVLTVAPAFGLVNSAPLMYLGLFINEHVEHFGNDATEAFGKGVAYVSIFIVASELQKWSVGYYVFTHGYQPVNNEDFQLSTIPEEVEVNVDEEHEVEVMCANPRIWAPCQSMGASAKRLYRAASRHLLLRWFTKPIKAILLGLVVALVPPLRNALITEDGTLLFIMAPVQTIGRTAIPLSFLVLGASINAFFEKRGSSSMDKRVVFGICVIKLLLLPCLAMIGVVLLQMSGRLPDDPVLKLVLVLETLFPTANSFIAMGSPVMGDKIEDLASVIIYEWIFAIFSITLNLTLFMWFIL